MLDGILAIQEQFNDAIINGISYAITNHPVIGWNGFGLVKSLTAICFLLAIIDVASKIADSKEFIVSFVRTIFYLVIVLANFGQIDHRKMLPIESTLAKYKTEYVKGEVPKSVQKVFANSGAKPIPPGPQLDRDLFNVVKGFFDELADVLSGAKSGSMDQQTMQGNALQSTLYFVNQARIAKMNCLTKQDAGEYSSCLGQYIPTTDPDPENLGKTPYNDVAACNGKKCKGQFDAPDDSATAAKQSKDGGLLDDLTGGISGLIQMIANLYLMVSFLFADFTFVILFPVIVWCLDTIRALASMYILLTVGFKTAGMFFFAKLMSPLILLDNKRTSVFNAYKSVFSMALFNFVSKLFISFSALMAIGLKNGVFDIMAKSIGSAASGTGAASLGNTGSLGTLMFLTYLGIFIVFAIQIKAISKITDMCNALMNFSVENMVSIGGEISGGAVKLAMLGSVALMAAPLLAGAAVAAAPAMAGAVASAGAGMAGSGAGALLSAKGAMTGAGAAMKAGNFMGPSGAFSHLSNAGSSLMEGGRAMARSGYNSAVDAGGSIADFAQGGGSGDKLRNMFGQQGGGAFPESLSASKSSNGDDSGEKKKSNNSKRKSSDSSGGSDDEGSNSGGATSNNNEGAGSNSNSGGTRSNRARQNNETDASKEPAGFLKNKWIQSAALGLKAFDGGLSAVEGFATGKSLTPMDAIKDFKRGYSKGDGLGNQINHKAFQEQLNSSIDQGRSSFVNNTNRILDNYSDDAKMAMHNKLKDDVNSVSMGDMSSEQGAQYEELLTKLKENPKDKEAVNNLYNLSQNYNLQEKQKEGLENLLRSDRGVSSEFERRRNAEQRIISKYMNSPTMQNASGLTTALNSGMISRKMISDSSGSLSAVADHRSEISMGRMSDAVQQIDADRYKNDESYKSSRDVKKKEQQMEALLASEYARSNMVGKKDLVDQLTKLGKMNPEDAAALKQFESKNDAENTINQLKKEVETLKKTSYMHINEDLKLGTDDDNNIFVMNSNNAIEDQGVLLSNITDENLKHKLLKYKNAVDIIIKNSNEYIGKKIVTEDQVQIMRKISSLIKT